MELSLEMDHGSWLWQRKSSDTSLGEIESLTSLSSQSERFSDDQAHWNQITHSSEVASKVACGVEELPDCVKTLKEELSNALIDINGKEELVNQHARVAEEAVTGWEKAENEVSTLKQQLEAVIRENSAMEDRVSHLDKALKECTSQLWQAREEKEQQIHESVMEKTHQRECTGTALKAQVADLQCQLESAKAKAAAPSEMISRKNFKVPSMELNLMDDFLEMEKLVALPEIESRGCCPKSGGECPCKIVLDTMIQQTAELEGKMEKIEEEKVKLEMALFECQKQVQASQCSLKETRLKLVELQTQLAQAKEKKKAVEGQLAAITTKREVEIKSLLSKVGVLEGEVEREKVLSATSLRKCKELEDELSKTKLEGGHEHAAMSNEDLKAWQEKERAAAASKLTECQQTIASLSRQLRSLATLEDFLIDSDCSEPRELHSGGGDSNAREEGSGGGDSNVREEVPLGNSTVGSDGGMKKTPGRENSGNGFGKLFNRSRKEG